MCLKSCFDALTGPQTVSKLKQKLNNRWVERYNTFGMCQITIKRVKTKQPSTGEDSKSSTFSSRRRLGFTQDKPITRSLATYV